MIRIQYDPARREEQDALARSLWLGARVRIARGTPYIDDRGEGDWEIYALERQRTVSVVDITLDSDGLFLGWASRSGGRKWVNAYTVDVVVPAAPPHRPLPPLRHSGLAEATKALELPR